MFDSNIIINDSTVIITSTEPDYGFTLFSLIGIILIILHLCPWLRRKLVGAKSFSATYHEQTFEHETNRPAFHNRHNRFPINVTFDHEVHQTPVDINAQPPVYGAIGGPVWDLTDDPARDIPDNIEYDGTSGSDNDESDDEKDFDSHSTASSDTLVNGDEEFTVNSRQLMKITSLYRGQRPGDLHIQIPTADDLPQILDQPLVISPESDRDEVEDVETDGNESEETAVERPIFTPSPTLSNRYKPFTHFIRRERSSSTNTTLVNSSSSNPRGRSRWSTLETPIRSHSDHELSVDENRGRSRSRSVGENRSKSNDNIKSRSGSRSKGKGKCKGNSESRTRTRTTSGSGSGSESRNRERSDGGNSNILSELHRSESPEEIEDLEEDYLFGEELGSIKKRKRKRNERNIKRLINNENQEYLIDRQISNIYKGEETIKWRWWCRPSHEQLLSELKLQEQILAYRGFAYLIDFDTENT
ncbi:uncharacterized protein I206_103392 [Kwoniella pini CBS 10737]|uniref:Uncharacterized protein n=1 Tax=Kwoniella pini CBS 10737 TaxID=1296096 RepID=A0A1B9I9R0_9TREE|nr:uncharacterized protein I206_01604 [Kwoniella pini CBS 10737]OCF52315.1 hypothetical protein I206_01604 [Kwoniella pini CBS 10737]